MENVRPTIENVEPNQDADPLELENGTVFPGSAIVRTSDGKPIATVIDTQDDSGGKGFAPGVIIRFLENDGLNFLAADKLDAWLGTHEYTV